MREKKRQLHKLFFVFGSDLQSKSPWVKVFGRNWTFSLSRTQFMLTTWRFAFHSVYCISMTSQRSFIFLCLKKTIELSSLFSPLLLKLHCPYKPDPDIFLFRPFKTNQRSVERSPGAWESEWVSERPALLLFPLLLINQQASGSEAVNNILKGMLDSIAMATGMALWSPPAALALLTPSVIRHSGQSPRGSLFNSFQADR